MIDYSEDEIKELIDKLHNPINLIYNRKSILFVGVQKYEIRAVFVREYDHTSIEDLITKELRQFLFEEPFDRVPMFVNIYPEFTSWRLRIGK